MIQADFPTLYKPILWILLSYKWIVKIVLIRIHFNWSDNRKTSFNAWEVNETAAIIVYSDLAGIDIHLECWVWQIFNRRIRRIFDIPRLRIHRSFNRIQRELTPLPIMYFYDFVQSNSSQGNECPNELLHQS